MRPIQNVAGSVLADLIRRQPSSPERTAFAWQIAVGPALGRVTTVRLDDGVLHVSAADPRWLKEIDRARVAILQRLQPLLGPATVRTISTT
jgi:hypothetical protein